MAEPIGAMPERQFAEGFAALKAQLGTIMGDPLAPVEGSDRDCDAHQLTTTGVAYWSCSDPVASFATGPDGEQHWALTASGLVRWIGPDAEVPIDAAPFRTGAPGGPDLPIWPCVSPGDNPSAACQLANGADLFGRLSSSGATNTYTFTVAIDGVEAVAELTNLPADYDLYLANTTGDLVAESVHEGTTPEQVDVVLPTGTYSVFVHADPGRIVDPESPYRLQLSLLTAGPETAAAINPESALRR